MRFGHRRGLPKAIGQPAGGMCIAAERDRTSPLVTPPLHEVGKQPYLGVDFEDPSAVSQRPQSMTELLLEGSPLKWTQILWPVPDRILDVSEHLEEVALRHESRNLGQVVANHGRWRTLGEQVPRLGKPVPVAKAVQGPEQTLKGAAS